MTTGQILVIDSNTYAAPFLEVQRKADMLYKTAERSEDGVLHSELIGVYFNYSVVAGFVPDSSLYSQLYDKLTEPVEEHQVQLPGTDGLMPAYSAYFANIRDVLFKATAARYYWKGLAFEVIAIGPHRT